MAWKDREGANGQTSNREPCAHVGTDELGSARATTASRASRRVSDISAANGEGRLLTRPDTNQAPVEDASARVPADLRASATRQAVGRLVQGGQCGELSM